MTARCKGLCCAAFYIQNPRFFEDPKRFTDGEKVAGMLVAITMEDLPVSTRRQLPTLQAATHATIHTCNRWDPMTKRCTKYEDRPALCRDFPYRDPCHVKGCRVGHPVRARFAARRQRRMAGK